MATHRTIRTTYRPSVPKTAIVSANEELEYRWRVARSNA
jgi:hypothetical protein